VHVLLTTGARADARQHFALLGAFKAIPALHLLVGVGLDDVGRAGVRRAVAVDGSRRHDVGCIDLAGERDALQTFAGRGHEHAREGVNEL